MALKIMQTSLAGKGVKTYSSKYTIDELVDRLINIFAAQNIKIFARIDQQKEAMLVGLQMPPMQLIIFGNPKAGTPLMIVNPLIGIDLPLKILVWSDKEGNVFLSYNTSEYLQKRFNLQDPPFEGVEKLINEVLK